MEKKRKILIWVLAIIVTLVIAAGIWLWISTSGPATNSSGIGPEATKKIAEMFSNTSNP